MALSLGDQATLNTIVDNCGFVQYRIDIAKSGDSASSPSITCAACLPGFKPTFTSKVITECATITNCDNTSTQNVFFNRCGACADGHIFGYATATHEVDYSTCEESTD